MTNPVVMTMTAPSNRPTGAATGGETIYASGNASGGAYGQNKASASLGSKNQPVLDFLARLEQAGGALPDGLEALGAAGEAAPDVTGPNLTGIGPQLAAADLESNPLAQFPGIVTVTAEGEINVDLEGLADILGVDVGEIDGAALAGLLDLAGDTPPDIAAVLPTGEGDLLAKLSEIDEATLTLPPAAILDNLELDKPHPMGEEELAALLADFARGGEEGSLPAPLAASGADAPLSLSPTQGEAPSEGAALGGSGATGGAEMPPDSALNVLAEMPTISEFGTAAATSDKPGLNAQGSQSSQGAQGAFASSAGAATGQGELARHLPLRAGLGSVGQNGDDTLMPNDQASFSSDARFSGEDGEMMMAQTIAGGKATKGGLAAAFASATGSLSGEGTLLDLPQLVGSLQKGAMPLQGQQLNLAQMGNMTAMEPMPDALLDVDQIVNGDIAPESELTTSAQTKMDVRPSSVDRVMTAEMPSRTIAIAMVRSADRGRAHFQMRLDPPELGRVDVRMSVATSGAVKAQLSFEKAETLELFQRDARALERALADAGLDVDAGGLEFSLSGDGAGAFQQALGDERGFSDQDGLSEDRVSALDEDDMPAHIDITRHFNGLDGRLNLLI